MEKLLDSVGTATPTKTKGATSTISNKDGATDPEDTQEPQITTNTTDWRFQTKVLTPSLTPLDAKEIEDKGIQSMEDLGWNDKEILASWIVSAATTKRKMLVTMDPKT